MAEQRYRFGGPIPESVQKLKSRREYRASSLYAGVKRSRRERFEAELDAAAGVSGNAMTTSSPPPTPTPPERFEVRALPKAALTSSGLR